MYNFDDKVDTKKYTAGKNTCEYIIIHHTAGGSYKSNLKYLSEGTAQASVHFVIGENGEAGKVGDPRNIMWHAGQSERGTIVGMNKYSLGIEVVGFGEYNIHQLCRLTDLVEYLMGVYNIPKERILRHSDITQGDASKKKILWDGQRKARKVDIGYGFFGVPFEKWRSQLIPRTAS